MADKKGKRKIELTDRDTAILSFLWHWKLSTTAAISMVFFPKSAPIVAYNRLLILKQAGLIKQQAFQSLELQYYWELSSKGFAMVRSHLRTDVEDGFRSEFPNHDLLTAAVQTGWWLHNTPMDVELFTEQELRRYPKEQYPSWIPKDKAHRPDGYWRVPYKGKTLTIAIEVELNQKKLSIYEAVAKFYADNHNVKRIVWLVPKLSMAKRLYQKFSSTVSPFHKRHLFILKDEFINIGWNAPVHFGYEHGRTLAFVIQFEKLKPMDNVMDTSWNSMASPFLDTRNCSSNSNMWTQDNKTKNLNRPRSYRVITRDSLSTQKLERRV